MAEAVIGAGAGAVIEYAVPKALTKIGDIATKTQAFMRCHEYRKFMYWTRSPLSISSALEWGHTCSLGIAIDEAASRLCTLDPAPTCWAFTSRHLAEQALGYQIEKERWACLVEWFFTERSTCEQFLVSKEEEEKEMRELVPCETYFLTSRLNNSFKKAFGSEHPLNNQIFKFAFTWMKMSDPDLWKELNDSDGFDINYYADTVAKDWADQSKFADMYQTQAFERSEINFDECFSTVQLLFDLHRLSVCASGLVSKCSTGHISVRDRSVRKSSCHGLDVHLAERRGSSSNSCDVQTFFKNEFIQLRDAWIFFLSDWGAITASASSSFQFMEEPRLNDLVLHDMSTGFCAPSVMRRRGAKCVSPRGATIVHPGEMAAVVSEQVRQIDVMDSAIGRLGVVRKLRPAAQEFADYALLRCDLVLRKRMTFSEAFEDWGAEHGYTRWDRAPSSLSEWKVQTETEWKNDDDIADSIRLVLLRQALGPMHSIVICKDLGVDAGIFGGYLHDSDGQQSIIPGKPIFLVDEMLMISFQKFNVNVSEKDNALLDMVGSKFDGTKPKKTSQYFKEVIRTGRNEIAKVGEIVKETCEPNKERPNKYNTTLWFE